jgi:hypothetical protein
MVPEPSEGNIKTVVNNDTMAAKCRFLMVTTSQRRFSHKKYKARPALVGDEFSPSRVARRMSAGELFLFGFAARGVY